MVNSYISLSISNFFIKIFSEMEQFNSEIGMVRNEEDYGGLRGSTISLDD